MVVVASKVAIELNLGKRALDDIDVIHIVVKSTSCSKCKGVMFSLLLL